jgi:hypothetical protein
MSITKPSWMEEPVIAVHLVSRADMRKGIIKGCRQPLILVTNSGRT